jgi:hypothetical protein
MNDTSLATSADYADAMLVARRAKNWLFLVLLLMLLVQIGLFFVARYTNAIIPADAATTRPTAMDKLHYLTGLTTFLGTILPVLLSLVLLLIVHIMLVGRLIGVARVTSAFVWCMLLMLLLFPWQAFLGNTTFDSPDFKIPGVLYTWDELVRHAKFGINNNVPIEVAVLKWARFLVMPLLAVVMLLMVQIKSNRGLRQALGEAPPAELRGDI